MYTIISTTDESLLASLTEELIRSFDSVGIKVFSYYRKNRALRFEYIMQHYSGVLCINIVDVVATFDNRWC